MLHKIFVVKKIINSINVSVATVEEIIHQN